MQFKPGNIINEYQPDGREGFKDCWLSSYIIVRSQEDNKTIWCACLFDITEDDDHKPGLSVAISKDIQNGVCNYYSGGFEGDVYWKEVDIGG